MKLRCRTLTVTVLVTFLLVALAVRHVDGKTAGQSLVDWCSGHDDANPTTEAISTALTIADDRDARAALAALEGPLRAATLAAPEDVVAQYHFAAVLGARVEREGGREKISVAKELHAQALRVIALEPDHAGANYLMGRLHAGVMRMGRMTRFLATRLLGGGVLKKASWSASQTFLEVAERAGPCEPDHHYELARLYGERKEWEGAERERLHVLELTTGSDGRLAAIRAKAERLSAVWDGKGR